MEAMAEAPDTAAVPTRIERLKTLIQEYGEVQSEGTLDTLQRFRLIAMAAVPLHFALAWWFSQFTAPAGRADMQAWADSLSVWQFGLAVVLLVNGLLMHQYLDRKMQYCGRRP